jgi:hypothetical protein
MLAMTRPFGIQGFRLPNGGRITCSPEGNAKTHQVARQPGAVMIDARLTRHGARQ